MHIYNDNEALYKVILEEKWAPAISTPTPMDQLQFSITIQKYKWILRLSAKKQQK
jgi:hypothetical protein